MVFESLVVDLINKYLGDYIVKLDKSQLKLGLLGGNVNLENLDIKENAFDSLDLPVKVLQGHISKLTLKIPWKHLYSEPVIAELDGLYVLVLPNSAMKYDASKEKGYQLEAKKKALDLIEENKLKRNEPKKDTITKDSFGEKLAAQIIKNLQINISNIHIRYEDTSPSTSRPFALGITLANLSFQTCDANGQSIIIKDDSIRDFFKFVKMDSLAVYWNSNPKSFSDFNQAILKATMKNNISSCVRRLSDINYFIQPISLSAMMQIHMKPETTQFTVPKFYLNLTLDQIGFVLTRNQYGDLVYFLDSVDRTLTKNQFRKYRPDVPLKSDIKIWWRFPYNAILEDQIRRKRRMWSWENIKAHRQRFHLYVNLYEKKMLDKKLTTDEVKQIENCEEELDLFNITLCRQQAEMKAKKAKKKLEDKKGTGKWFSGWFGKSDTDSARNAENADGSNDWQNKIRTEFTQEEKGKLFQAIGYSEQTADPDIPKEYISLILNVKLQKLTFLLSDEALKEKKLLQLTVYDMAALVNQRSAADSIKVGLTINRMTVIGSKYDDGSVPTLVSTQCVSQTTDLLNVEFETNPLDQSANQKIDINAEPLEIIYDSETINRVVKFFAPPDEVQLYELSTQVMASLEDVKEMTATSLRHLADQRLYTDIKVDIKPSYFILPEHGKYFKNCKMLLVDLGSISIISERTNAMASGDLDSITKDGKLDYDSIKESAYDKFRITLSTIQVLMIERGDDWEHLRIQESSKNHILKPFGFKFNLKKCAIINDINLPKLSIKGCLPHLGISLSDVVLQSLLELIFHVPFPETAPPQEVPTTEEIIKTSFNIKPTTNMTTNQVIRAIDVLPDSETASLTSTVDIDDDDEFKDALEEVVPNRSSKKKSVKQVKTQNLIDLEAKFVISTVELQVFEGSKVVSHQMQDLQEIMKLEVKDIGTTITMKRFDKQVQAYIGSLVLSIPKYTDPNTKSSICLAKTIKHVSGHDLLFINLNIVEKTSPEFVSVFKCTRHTLKCEFKSLEVCLHQEALLLVVDFLKSLIPAFNPVAEEVTENWSAKIGDVVGQEKASEKRMDIVEDKKKGLPDTSVLGVITTRMDVTSEKKSARLQAETEAERMGKKIYIPEISMIQWAVEATLDKFQLSIAGERQGRILEVFVHGMRANVSMSYTKTEIGVVVTDFIINDPNPQATYKKIIWFDEAASILSMQVVVFSQGTSTPGFELELSRIDHMVNLQVGKVKMIFLYNFVMRIQSFFNTFQSSLQAVSDKALEYSEAAANKISNVLEEPPSSRTLLNIQLEAPVIYVPENSKSSNALVVDLGSLGFVNKFSLMSNTIVLDESSITLQNLTISRSIFVETAILNEKGVLKPINIDLHMTRNLSWNKVSKIPQIDLKATVHSISVAISQGDFSMILLILQSNLAENDGQINIAVDQTGHKVVEDPKKDIIKEEKTTLRPNNVDDGMNDVITVQFALHMNFLNIELLKGDPLPNEWHKPVAPESQFTKMNLENLSVEGHMLLNTAMDVNVKLCKVNLVDTQTNSSNRITDLIRKKSDESKDFVSVKFLKEVNGDSTLIADVAGIYMCISVEYLMALADFFVKGLPSAIASDNKDVVLSLKTEEKVIDNRPKKLPTPVLEPRLSDFKVEVQIERPEILLVEDINKHDSKAIMLETKVTFKYAMLKEKDLINVDIADLQAFYCPFKQELRKKNTMTIISRTSIGFYCNKPINDGMQGSLTIEQIVLNINPAVIQSISKIVQTLQQVKTDEDSSKDKLSINNQEACFIDNFWEMQKFHESDLSFISKGLLDNQNKNGDNVEEYGFDVSQMFTSAEKRRPDQFYIRLPEIKIILESVLVKKTVPILIVECSIDGDLKNPSTLPCVDVTVCLSISYFNDTLNAWEPLIEVYSEENNRQYSLQLEYVTADDSNLFEDESEELVNISPPNVSVRMISRDNLELTLSKTALDVLTKLGKAFEDAYALHLEDHRTVVGAPYLIKNTSGKDVVIYIKDEFNLKSCNSDEKYKVLIKDKEEMPLYDNVKARSKVITEEKQEKTVELRFADSDDRIVLSIHKSELRGLLFGKNTEDISKKVESNGLNMDMLVVSTTSYLGMKNIEFRSLLQVVNNTEDELSLYYNVQNASGDKKEYLLIDQVVTGKVLDVPIPVLLNSTGQIFIGVNELKTDISSSGALWNIGQKVPQPVELECKTKSDAVYYYSSILTLVDIPVWKGSEKRSSHTYKLEINVPLILHNQLPMEISYQSQMFCQNIEPGRHKSIKTICLNVSSELKITFNYQNKDWFGILELRPKMDEFSVINFKAKEGFDCLQMDLGIHLLIKNGQASVTIYSPYWMINKTGHNLAYKTGDDFQVEHNANNKDAILFSFLSKSFFNKKKAHLKINDSNWSDKFSLDTVGNSGKVACKMKPINYEIGVKINLSSSGLTKIVTFLPYYMILNQSPITLFCNEICDDSWITVPPGEAVPFWPKSEVGKLMMMKCKIEENVLTEPFPFYESHSILMKLNKRYNGLFVEVQITEEASLINLQLYQEGMALVKLVNHLGDDAEIHYKQYGTDQELTLPPSHSVMYAWQDGRQKRELLWRGGNTKKHQSNSLASDGIGDFFINEMKAYWVSFVWESYRILLFTNNIYVAKDARLNADIENIDQEITLSMHSIGLSLVNNLRCQELAYISVISSGVKWNQLRKNNRQKPLKLAQSEALEFHYEDFLNKKQINDRGLDEFIVKIDGLEVDLNKKLMLKPEKCELVRVFEPGVYLLYRTSAHQMHIHLRVYKIQIDNQMLDCNFPVVFSPFRPPRSVALDIGLKPLIEMSAIIIKHGESEALRFKYFRILIQEMQLMLDQGFVNSILDFISGTVPVYDETVMFNEDCEMIRNNLIDTPTIKSILQGGRKCVFDDFHISPIKIHLSFSLSRVGGGEKTALHSEVLNLFLQSVGIVVTDMQDVVFKLGYFEKKSSIMPTNQMVTAITNHYVNQALRQMYVLILGLDVLGNPFGVIRGVAQGVEDLFYEPVRGAILGPEEFVDGVTYGVRSLFGHAVGGAAGAVSRIVGTMGKGIAALTLDADYQRKRREQLSKRPENLGVGLAQGGKGLIFGIVQGVTGVVTKPIDGAKKEGVEGFFKGVGKGLVGVVTRPVSGVVDFASSSFEGIRRATDTNFEAVRVRPPRYIAKDGIIRPYGLRKAEGSSIWNKVKEKTDRIPDEYYMFHVYCKTKRNVILLSNERVFQLEHNDILGIWSIQWEMAYNKLDGAPVANEPKSTIIFKLKEKQRKMFSKDHIIKEIETDLDSVKAIIEKVVKIQKSIEMKK